MNVKRGLRKISIVFLLTCFAWMGWGCGETQIYDVDSSIIKVGDALPAFSVTDMKVEVYRKLSLKCAVSVIIFF